MPNDQLIRNVNIQFFLDRFHAEKIVTDYASKKKIQMSNLFNYFLIYRLENSILSLWPIVATAYKLEKLKKRLNQFVTELFIEK